MQYSTKNKTITAARTTFVTYHPQQQLLLAVNTLRTHAPNSSQIIHKDEEGKQQHNTEENIPIFLRGNKNTRFLFFFRVVVVLLYAMAYSFVYTYIWSGTCSIAHREVLFYVDDDDDDRDHCVKIHTSFCFGCSLVLSFSFSCIEPGVCMSVDSNGRGRVYKISRFWCKIIQGPFAIE